MAFNIFYHPALVEHCRRLLDAHSSQIGLGQLQESWEWAELFRSFKSVLVKKSEKRAPAIEFNSSAKGTATLTCGFTKGRRVY